MRKSSDMFSLFKRDDSVKKDNVRESVDRPSRGPYVKYGIGFSVQKIEKTMTASSLVELQNAKFEKDRMQRQMKQMEKKNKQLDAALRQSQDGMRQFLQEVRTLSQEVQGLEKALVGGKESPRNKVIAAAAARVNELESEVTKMKGELGEEKRKRVEEEALRTKRELILETSGDGMKAPPTSPLVDISGGDTQGTNKSFRRNEIGSFLNQVRKVDTNDAVVPTPRGFNAEDARAGLLGLRTTKPPGVGVMLAQKFTSSKNNLQALDERASVNFGEESDGEEEEEEMPRRVFVYREEDDEEEDYILPQARTKKSTGKSREDSNNRNTLKDCARMPDKDSILPQLVKAPSPDIAKLQTVDEECKCFQPSQRKKNALDSAVCVCGARKADEVHRRVHVCKFCGDSFTAITNQADDKGACAVHHGEIKKVGIKRYAWSCCPERPAKASSLEEFRAKKIAHNGFHS